MMTKSRFIFVLAVLLGSFANAQSCDCESEFLFLKKQIENNYSGFADKVRDDNRKLYLNTTSSIHERAKQTNDQRYCFGLMKEWVSFFEDGHIQFGEKGSKPELTEELVHLIEQREIINLSKGELNRLVVSESIEGLYYSTDSAYKIAIVKSPNSQRDYAGVIIDSKSSNWKPGHVKLELKYLGKSKFIAYTYSRDHIRNVTEYQFDGNTLNGNVWIREGANVKRRAIPSFSPIGSNQISSQTLYIQIGSFDPWNADAIDSVFKQHESDLKITPNLILDLRGNGGGADFTYEPILPYLYTQPFYNIGVNVLASEENTTGWQKLLTNDQLPQSTKDWVKEITDKMAKNIGKQVNVVPDDTTTFESVLPNPIRIVVLIDGQCASSTEEFLLRAVQSKKVTLMGQSTKGVLDYGNLRDVDFPCMPYTLHYATTRSRRIDIGKGIDNIGIQPDKLLSESQDWIIEATKFLEKINK